MNVKPHHTPKELQKRYRTENNARLARRIHGVYLASKGLACPQIMEITGSARRTIQQWVHKYNAGGIETLKDSPRPGQPTKLSRGKEPAFRKRIEAGPTDKDEVSVFQWRCNWANFGKRIWSKLFSLGYISSIVSTGLFLPLPTPTT